MWVNMGVGAIKQEKNESEVTISNKQTQKINTEKRNFLWALIMHTARQKNKHACEHEQWNRAGGDTRYLLYDSDIMAKLPLVVSLSSFQQPTCTTFVSASSFPPLVRFRV
jgi:hypothetical protein